MVRCIFAILLGLAALLPLEAQTLSKAEGFPSVSISLPPNIPSETVQIAYHLVGPFGGHGGYTELRPGLHSYEIAASVEGKAATEIRMIVYASGCEIQTFGLPLAQDSRVKQEFECQRVATVELSGQIVPTELVRDNNAELVVTYMAYWAHGFFGIVDGMVTEFRLATVSPDGNGIFQVELPYFSADAAASSSQRRASFWLMLRDSKTWNHIASSLEPEVPELRLEEHSLRIRSHYPGGLKFTSIDRPRVVIDVVELNGATHLPEAVQEQLVASLKQREYEEDSDWIGDVRNIVIRAETDSWPDRENQGYIGFSVEASRKPLRRESGLLHVLVTVSVDEGRQKRVGKIEFRYVGAHLVPPVFGSDDLRKLIPLQDGEIYSGDKYRAGLSAVSRAYSERGFIDCTVTNNMEFDQVNQTIAIMIDVNEGSQYRWGKIQVIGLDPKIETLLRSRLTTGSRVNPKLIRDFYRDNKSLLPVGASPESVKWQSDAQRAIVDLTFDFTIAASPPVHD